VLNKKKNRKWSVLTEEKLHEIGAFLEIRPRKSLTRLSAQCGVSLGSAHTATRFMKLRLYTITVVQRLTNTNSGARIHFCSWLLGYVHDGIVNPELLFFSDEAWLHLSGYVNTQNNRFWSSENPHQLHEHPLHDIKVGAWCAVTSKRIIGPVFYNETINSQRYVNLILRPFFQELTDKEKTAMLQLILLIGRSSEVFGDQVIDQWPPCSPDLHLCNFYLWGMLKDKAYVHNSHMAEELKEYIR
jgi:hypothetical protein